MSCDPGEPRHRMHEHGALPPGLVAGISGIGPERLECWRADGLLPASLENPDPAGARDEGDPDRFYTLDDLARVLAAAKLLQLGLAEAELPAALARLDHACARWATDLAPIRIKDAFPASVDFDRFIAERRHEDRLGRLHEYADVVEMAPGRMSSKPVIRGRRVDTETLARFHFGGASDEEIAASFRLTPRQVRRALAFERVAHAEWFDAHLAG